MGITLEKKIPEVVGADAYDQTCNEYLGIIESAALRRECNLPVQVKGVSHCPVEVMRTSLHTGYCLTLKSAGLAAKLPFFKTTLTEKGGKSSDPAMVKFCRQNWHFSSEHRNA